ncbi:hypothetical protein ACOME3_000286 [Neoechinorhynchus agilis]
MKSKSRSNKSKKELRNKNRSKKQFPTTHKDVLRLNKKTIKQAADFLEEEDRQTFQPVEFDNVDASTFFKPSECIPQRTELSSQIYSDLIKPLDPTDEQALIELTGFGHDDDEANKKVKSLSQMIEESLLKKREIMQKHLIGFKGPSDSGPPTAEDKIIALYRQMGPVLAKYRSGKLPKAFKVLPTLREWEHLLAITRPDNWSAAIVFQATRIFASNMNEKLVQKFYSDTLLPRIRDDIVEYKRLNYHLFMAVRKAMFKPGAFFKGLILPLVESGSCTIREAVILGAIIEKSSLPMLHVAVALYILCQGEGSGSPVPSESKVLIEQFAGARSIFIRVLLEKRYNLPYKVVNAVFDHFMRFAMLDNCEGKQPYRMPVIFHQSLLCFVRNYVKDLSHQQTQMIDGMVRGTYNLVPHNDIAAEIRKIIATGDDR